MNIVILSPTALMEVMKSTAVSFDCYVVIDQLSVESLLPFGLQTCLAGILTCSSAVMVTALHLRSIVTGTMIVATGPTSSTARLK